jgi:uncharacterized protein (DUF952 family)
MTDHRQSASADTGYTHHLARRAEWESQRKTAAYCPSAFESDGFVHCTDGLDRLLTPANAYFRADVGPFVVLEIDLGRVAAPVRYDADPPIYPHVYGPIEPSAVVATYLPERTADGTFTGFRPVPTDGPD